MSGRTIVLLSLEPWDGVWRRNQYLADGLLRADPHLRIVFVEPPRDLLHDSVARRRPSRGAGLRTAEGYEGRLTLFQPTKWLPRLGGPLADSVLRSSLRRALQKSDVASALLWVNDPNWAALVEVGESPSLYDLTDDWLEAQRPRREHARLVHNDSVLMQRCSAVIACSPALRTSRSGTRDDVILIPNAVDISRYRSQMPRPPDVPGTPFALYVGTLHEDRLDVELVERTGAALASQGSACILVGPNALTERNRRILEAAPGVMALGPRHHSAIPGYLQHAAALLVPHLINSFTDSLDPIKLYEYLAVGRPVVSTAVAGFRDYAHSEAIAIENTESFPTAVARIASEARPTVFARDVPDWQERVQQFTDVIHMIFREEVHQNDVPSR